jgi:hypothetical protein
MSAQDVLLAFVTVIALAVAWWVFFGQGECQFCGQSADKNISISQCLRALELNPACFGRDGKWNSSSVPNPLPEYCLEYNKKFEPKRLTCGEPPEYPKSG